MGLGRLFEEHSAARIRAGAHEELNDENFSLFQQTFPPLLFHNSFHLESSTLNFSLDLTRFFILLLSARAYSSMDLNYKRFIFIRRMDGELFPSFYRLSFNLMKQLRYQKL